MVSGGYSAYGARSVLSACGVSGALIMVSSLIKVCTCKCTMNVIAEIKRGVEGMFCVCTVKRYIYKYIYMTMYDNCLMYEILAKWMNFYIDLEVGVPCAIRVCNTIDISGNVLV